MKTIILFCCAFYFFYNSFAQQNVGIGILTPIHKLHVINSTASINTIHGENYGNANGSSCGVDNNFSALHGLAGSGATQYQAGVYGIGAVKEQQAIIISHQKRMDELEKIVAAMKKKF